MVYAGIHLGCQHGEVGCSIAALIEVVGVSRNLGEVARGMVELGIPLSTLQDALGLQDKSQDCGSWNCGTTAEWQKYCNCSSEKVNVVILS